MVFQFSLFWFTALVEKRIGDGGGEQETYDKPPQSQNLQAMLLQPVELGDRRSYQRPSATESQP